MAAVGKYPVFVEVVEHPAKTVVVEMSVKVVEARKVHVKLDAAGVPDAIEPLADLSDTS